jgi:hypothetical protein
MKPKDWQNYILDNCDRIFTVLMPHILVYRAQNVVGEIFHFFSPVRQVTERLFKNSSMANISANLKGSFQFSDQAFSRSFIVWLFPKPLFKS